MGVQHSFKKMKPQLCFRKPSLVIVALLKNATIGYSLESVCVCFRVCVCVFA